MADPRTGFSSDERDSKSDGTVQASWSRKRSLGKDIGHLSSGSFSKLRRCRKDELHRHPAGSREHRYRSPSVSRSPLAAPAGAEHPDVSEPRSKEFQPT